MNARQWQEQLKSGVFRSLFTELYDSECVDAQVKRYCETVDRYVALFGDAEDLRLFSAPGRTELGGNHTDHQNGRVLVASIDLDVIAVAAKNDSNVIHIQSEGHCANIVQLGEPALIEEEKGTSTALVRGIAARFQELGMNVGGFTAFTTSNVLRGSGLSSSAAYEVLVGTICSGLYNEGTVDPVKIAQIGQYAENRYFGKPCGLMDQMASSAGGLVLVDFENPEMPDVKRFFYDFAGQGYRLCVVNTGGSHADLTEEYAAIPAEMKAVAKEFGKDVLRSVEKEMLLKKISFLRKKHGDRALLRALHFVSENERVEKQAQMLRTNNAEGFLSLVRASGHSSFCLLQNVVSAHAKEEQGLALALALTEEFLQGKGACRVHGGGFAGTIQVYIPSERAQEYQRQMEAVFGAGCCYPLRVRPRGGLEIKEKG